MISLLLELVPLTGEFKTDYKLRFNNFMFMKKRYFTKEFKLNAVSLAQERENVAEVSRELDIRHDMLRRWIKEYSQKRSDAFNGSGFNKPKDKKLSELQALKKELRETKLERDILKKVIYIFSKSDGINIDLS